MNSTKPILLVEDDDVDAMTVRRALKEIKVTNELVHRVNGEEALDYLQADDSPKPCIILLDLNMPKMNGFEFLAAMRENENIRKIPVIVLTTSDTEHDVVESYQFNVAGYMVKPVDYKQFVEAMRMIHMYWTFSELPPDSEDEQQQAHEQAAKCSG